MVQFQAEPETITYIICNHRVVIFSTIHGKINDMVNFKDWELLMVLF